MLIVNFRACPIWNLALMIRHTTRHKGEPPKIKPSNSMISSSINAFVLVDLKMRDWLPSFLLMENSNLWAIAWIFESSLSSLLMWSSKILQLPKFALLWKSRVTTRKEVLLTTLMSLFQSQRTYRVQASQPQLAVLLMSPKTTP